MNITNLSRLKLEQIASECGSTVSPVVLGQLLADPRQTPASIAGILSTTPAWFARALALPEPVVHGPMTTSDVMAGAPLTTENI